MTTLAPAPAVGSASDVVEEFPTKGYPTPFAFELVHWLAVPAVSQAVGRVFVSALPFQ